MADCLVSRVDSAPEASTLLMQAANRSVPPLVAANWVGECCLFRKGYAVDKSSRSGAGMSLKSIQCECTL